MTITSASNLLLRHASIWRQSRYKRELSLSNICFQDRAVGIEPTLIGFADRRLILLATPGELHADIRESTGREIRTPINSFLRPAPLPKLGYSGKTNPAGIEPANLLLRTQAL